MKSKELYKKIGESLTNSDMADAIFEDAKAVFALAVQDDMVLAHIAAEAIKNGNAKDDEFTKHWIPIFKSGLANNLADLIVMIRAFVATNFETDEFNKILDFQLAQAIKKSEVKRK